MSGYTKVPPLGSGEFALTKQNFGQINDAVYDLKTRRFNVKDYGAVWDGVADDTTKAQDAIDAAYSAGGGQVELPRGAGKVGNLVLKPRVQLVGVGSQAINNTDGSVLVGTNGVDLLTLQSGIDAHMAARDIAFYGGKNQIVFNGTQTSHVAVERCGFFLPSEASIRVLSGAVEELVVRKCRGNGGQYFFKHDNVVSGGFNYLDKTHFLDCIAGGHSINNFRIEVNLSTSVTWTNLVLNSAQKHAFYADGGIRAWTFINTNQEGCGLAGKENRTTLSGTVSSGATSATLASATGWATGDGMTIAGAGTNGQDFTILSTAQGGPGVTISGTTVSWTGGTNTTVTNPIVTNAEYDEFHFSGSISLADSIQFLGGKLGGSGSGAHIRYCINAKGIQTAMSLFGTEAISSYPVYDPNFVVGVGAGCVIPVRRPNNFSGTERFQASWFNGADDTGETKRTQIASPAGKDIVMGLRDSLGNLTGTIGEFQVRRGDPNRTKVFGVDGNHPVNAQWGFQMFTKAGAPTDADWETAPPNGTMAIDTTNNKIYVRIGGTWKGVVVA
jgi:hypothetical protein